MRKRGAMSDPVVQWLFWLILGLIALGIVFVALGIFNNIGRGGIQEILRNLGSLGK